MRIVAALLSVAVAAAAAVAVRAADPDQTLAGPGPSPALLLLGVAVTLAAAGAALWRRRPRAAAGPLLLCAADAWCASQLASPAARSAVLFTLGLAVGAAAPGAIALALLPGRRAGAALAAASAGLLGVVSALVFDPRASGCAECPRNLLLVHGDAGWFEAAQRAGLWLGLAAIAGLLVAASAWLRRAGAPARVRQGPTIVAATAYLAAVAAQYAHGLSRGYVAADATDRTLWAVEGAALLAAAAGVAWELLRERRARSRLAHLVIELEARPEPRGLRDVLAEVLADPGVRLAYRVGDGRRVDGEGRPVEPAPGQEITALIDGDEPLAELMHAPGRLDDPGLAPAIASAARLALQNERLHAELLARLGDLRAMRGRIVAAGDGERRRLERDLHDGAQQRLAGLAVALEAARRRAADPERAAALAGAHSDVRAALGQLRDVAHGLVPAVLADEGLGPAVEAFAETADAVVRLPGPLPDERFAPEVETTAYYVVTEAVRRAAPTEATVRVLRRDGRLVLSVETADPPRGELVDLDDRVGALGGTLRAQSARIVAELPCG